MGIRDISPELQKAAAADLGEDQQRIEEDLKVIKEWINKQAHLNARMDDQWLIAFLRGCKYSLERTKEKLDTFYALRSAIPNVCTNLDPMDSTCQEILKCGFFVPLTQSVPGTGQRVNIVRPGRYDATKLTVLDTMKINYMTSMIQMMEDDNSIIAGQLFVVDLEGVTMNHFTQMTPANVKKMVKLGQDALPFRQKGTHHVNTPPGAETVFAIFKRFMNEKNRNRLFIHGSHEDLYQYVPKEILPSEYGGNAGSIEDMTEIWKKKVESYREWFLKDEQFKTNENKRVGTPKTPESLFGIEGSFRKLNVD